MSRSLIANLFPEGEKFTTVREQASIIKVSIEFTLNGKFVYETRSHTINTRYITHLIAK
jgi:hypothetical protein